MCVLAVTGMDNSSHKVKSSECACRKQRRQLEFRLGWEIISELVKVDASQKAESRGKGFYAPTKCQESVTKVICPRWPGIFDERMGLARRRKWFWKPTSVDDLSVSISGHWPGPSGPGRELKEEPWRGLQDLQVSLQVWPIPSVASSSQPCVWFG